MQMLIGMTVKDMSYNLNRYSFPLIFGWGGGQISSSCNDNNV